MNVVIVEDEKLAADKLQRQLRKIRPEFNVVARLGSVKETVEWLELNECQLIFIDIHLADGNSFQIFEQVDVDTPVIFTTAYDEYAISAFKQNSVDYLLKPIATKDLENAVQKYERLYSSGDPQAVNVALQSLLKKDVADYQQAFLIHGLERLQRIPVSEIAYFFAEAKHVFLVAKDGRQHVVDIPLDKLELKLDPKQFFRINRKLFVHMQSVRQIHAWPKSKLKLDLQPNYEGDALVSSDKTKPFKAWLESSPV